MKRLLAGLLFTFMFAVGASAQTTYDSISVGVNAGDHSWATFIFGHGVDGEPGTTELIVQCAFHRAELITNFDVFGEQQVSQFFAVTCTQQGPIMVNGVPTTTWTVNATPLSESLVMNPGDANLSLLVNSATWTFAGYCGHGHCSGPGASGSAEIAY